MRIRMLIGMVHVLNMGKRRWRCRIVHLMLAPLTVVHRGLGSRDDFFGGVAAAKDR